MDLEADLTVIISFGNQRPDSGAEVASAAGGGAEGDASHIRVQFTGQNFRAGKPFV